VASVEGREGKEGRGKVEVSDASKEEAREKERRGGGNGHELSVSP